MRDPVQYEKELDKLNTVLSEKFGPDLFQQVFLAIDSEVAVICADISKKIFMENILEWTRPNKFISSLIIVGITFLIRPCLALAGQNSPTKKVVPVTPPPYAISSHQMDVAQNLVPIDAEKCEIKESVTHSSPQNSTKKKQSNFIFFE